MAKEKDINSILNPGSPSRPGRPTAEVVERFRLTPITSSRWLGMLKRRSEIFDSRCIR